MEPKEWIAVITSVTGLAISIYALVSNRKRDNQKKFEEFCDRVIQLETKVGPWWAVMEKMALDILHHPTMYERDMLIDKYQTDEGLTRAETQTLLEMFWETIQDEKAPPREIFAAMLMASRLQAQLATEDNAA